MAQLFHLLITSAKIKTTIFNTLCCLHDLAENCFWLLGVKQQLLLSFFQAHISDCCIWNRHDLWKQWQTLMSNLVQYSISKVLKTRCVGTTRMSRPWILRRLANVSPFFNSLSNRLRITNYCLRSASSSLHKFTRFIQGNNIAWTNFDMIRNLQHLHMNKKSYTYKTLPFNSHWIFFWIKSVMWSE